MARIDLNVMVIYRLVGGAWACGLVEKSNYTRSVDPDNIDRQFRETMLLHHFVDSIVSIHLLAKQNSKKG